MKMLIQFWFQHGGRSSCHCSGVRRVGGWQAAVCGVTVAVDSLGVNRAERQFPGLMESLTEPAVITWALPPQPQTQGKAALWLGWGE